MVINLDSSAGGGTHWVACYVSKNQVEYVHSFGLELSTRVINTPNWTEEVFFIEGYNSRTRLHRN